jgi:hypothetical protein
VETRRKKASDLSKAWKFELWRQADGEPTREAVVKMLNARFTNRNGKGER